MPGQYILAHDLGTTGNKASLYDGEGRLSPARSMATAWRWRTPTGPSRTRWIGGRRCACRRSSFLPRPGWSAVDVACVSFSGQMMGCVAVDRQARPLRNAIIWADMRAAA